MSCPLPGTTLPLFTLCLLVLSNLLMTLAWYGHLKHQSHQCANGKLIKNLQQACCRGRVDHGPAVQRVNQPGQDQCHQDSQLEVIRR